MNQINIWIKISIFFIITLMVPNILQATIYEAENANLNGAVIASNHTGFSGTGFVDYQNPNNDYIEWTVNADLAGQYLLNFRYALSSGDRPLEITVNGVVVAASQSFPATGGWTSWGTTADLNVNLIQGNNTIRATATGISGANVDYLEVNLVIELSMTKDSNISGDILPGETFTYTIIVENDAAALGDATNVTVRDPLPTGVTYIAESTVAIGPIYTNATDDFISDDFSGGSGWTDTSWTQNGTTVVISAEARMQDNGSHIYRSVNLSGISTATVSFDVRENGNHNIQDRAIVEICTDTTFGNCQTLFNRNNDFPDESISNEPIDADKLTSTATFRARVINYQGNNEYFYIDNIVIQGQSAGNVVKDNNTSTANLKLLDGDLSGTGEDLVVSGDNFILAPGETLTVTFEVIADDNLTNIPNITNTAFASSDELSGEINASTSNTTVPVTISYAYPQLKGSSLELDFSTATETANVGFNVYAVKGKGKRNKQWTKLNVELIPSTVFDSLVPTDYQVSLELPDELEVKKIGIAGVDVNGKEDRHGPFKINKESGSKAEVVPITWESIRSAVKQDKKERKAKRKAKRASKKALKKTMKEQIVNIEVDQDAVYRITHEELMAEDIDLRGFKADKIAVSLRGEGVARAIEELTEKGKWTENSAIEFVGEAPKDSDALYLSSNLYRLSFNKKQVVKSEEIEAMTTKELVFEANNVYSWTIPGPDPFYDKMFYTRGAGTPGVLTRTFTLDEIPETEMELSVHVSGFSKLTHNLNVALNGSDIGSIQQSGYGELVIQTTVSATMLNQGENQITITAQGEGTNIDVFMYDKTVLSYDDGQANEVQTPVISFNDRLRKKEIKPKRGTTYLIISHPLFIGETLDRYVTQKEGEGWNIQVVDVEDIYSAYGYGMATPEAIKAYLDVAKRKGVTHVQLVGAASYDYHDYLGLGSVSFIPSIYVPTGEIVNYTPCDSCLVADENGLPELAIGRWPVRTAAGLEAMINKSLDWKNSGQSSAKTALMIADEKEEGADFAKQMEALSQQLENSDNWNSVTRVYMDDELAKTNDNSTEAVAAARGTIMESLNNGVSVVSFSGHSAPTVWSFKRLLKYNDAASITNEGQTALALPLACYTNYADDPSVNTMAHQFLAEGENGFVAIYGAATLSNFNQNGVSASKVTDHLLRGETIGEAVLNTKRELGMNYSDIIRNSNLLGDVTLEIN